MEDCIQFYHKNDSLIKIANNLCKNYDCPLPLRRTFSLMREFGFETLCIEPILCTKNSDSLSCKNHKCGDRYDSCKDYIFLLENKYYYSFLSKKCYKISFFDIKVEDKNQLFNLLDSNILAYCILHIDSYIDNDEKKSKSYVTESTIRVRDRRKDFFLNQKHITKFKILDRDFELLGNYFSQQNNITNCCAHAAIKMSLKAFYKNIKCEQINKHLKDIHEKRKGYKGFNPNEFEEIITELTNSEVSVIDGTLISPWDFVKLIYHAIESRFPVILLFSHPNENGFLDGHATALIGHTFDKSNWWGYGQSSYFNSSKSKLYLPSLLWCGNFIIQDDNLGPYYRMPISSLRATNLPTKFPFWLKYILKKINKEFLRHFIPFSYWPTYAIITNPKDSVDFLKCIDIEKFAIEQLYLYINNKLIGSEYEPKNNEQFYELFLHFIKNKMIVARTFAVKKNEYLGYYCETYQNENMKEVIDSLDFHLKSEYIWLIEVSASELYWVNEKKLCDIVCEPFILNKQKKQFVKYLRVPSHHCFFFDDFSIASESFEEKDSRYPLLSPLCNSCFS